MAHAILERLETTGLHFADTERATIVALVGRLEPLVRSPARRGRLLARRPDDAASPVSLRRDFELFRQSARRLDEYAWSWRGCAFAHLAPADQDVLIQRFRAAPRWGATTTSRAFAAWANYTNWARLTA